MNSSPQNTNTTGTGQRRTAGVDNSDEEEWSGVVECVIILLLSAFPRTSQLSNNTEKKMEELLIVPVSST